MSEAAVLSQPPAVQLAAGGDGGAVGAAAGDVTDAFGLQGLDEPRFVTVPENKRDDFALIPGRVHAKPASFSGVGRRAGGRGLKHTFC